MLLRLTTAKTGLASIPTVAIMPRRAGLVSFSPVGFLFLPDPQGCGAKSVRPTWRELPRPITNARCARRAATRLPGRSTYSRNPSSRSPCCRSRISPASIHGLLIRKMQRPPTRHAHCAIRASSWHVGPGKTLLIRSSLQARGSRPPKTVKPSIASTRRIPWPLPGRRRSSKPPVPACR